MGQENRSIGVLLAAKAFIQLICNPIVGSWAIRCGYRLPIVVGTLCLLITSLGFALGEKYSTLLMARAIQGIGSACIGVCSMSLVAEYYSDEEERSKIMGVLLGSIALGVLVGYPFGGILYSVYGKSTPFFLLSIGIIINLGIQMAFMGILEPLTGYSTATERSLQSTTKWQLVLQNRTILMLMAAICLSTSSMAILEPCLPIWLMEHLHVSSWQLGTVFIPDSLGYFVGTNSFAGIAFKYGQIEISCLSLLLVGISSIGISLANSVFQLLIPHFGLGLGIGIIDAALVPLLATILETITTSSAFETEELMSSNRRRRIPNYGAVYAIQQTSISLAYSLAPAIGGELAPTLGFVWLMRLLGCFNIAYGLLMAYIQVGYFNPRIWLQRRNEISLTEIGTDQPISAETSSYFNLYRTLKESN